MPDRNDKAIPPYSDRKKAGNVRDKGSTARDGTKVGGAHGPVENDELSRPDAQGGTTGSRADEQPARQSARTRDHDEGVGPAHEPGTRRGEHQRR